MSRKAEMKARRELLGLSQSDLAAMLGVDKMNVKRWERPGQAEPRQFVFDLLADLEELRAQAVTEALQIAELRSADTIQLTYYRDQEQYDLLGRDAGPFGMANANAREVALRLQDLDVKVEWAYPDDESNIYHSRQPRGI